MTVSHAGHPTASALAEDNTLDDADVAGNVTLNTSTEIITNAETTGAELTMTGDGDKINITVGFTAPLASSTESLKLMFDLAATADQENLMLPLDEGVVEVWVTMAPNESGGRCLMEAPWTEYFAVNYIPADGVVAFTIAPASCTLLFPYAAVVGDMGVWDWDTGIAIANPSAFTDTPLEWKTSRSPCFRTMGIWSMYPTNDMSPGRGSGP